MTTENNNVSVFELMMFQQIRANLQIDDVTYDNTSNEWKDDLAYKTMMVVTKKMDIQKIYERYVKTKERCSDFKIDDYL